MASSQNIGNILVQQFLELRISLVNAFFIATGNLLDALDDHLLITEFLLEVTPETLLTSSLLSLQPCLQSEDHNQGSREMGPVGTCSQPI